MVSTFAICVGVRPTLLTGGARKGIAADAYGSRMPDAERFLTPCISPVQPLAITGSGMRIFAGLTVKNPSHMQGAQRSLPQTVQRCCPPATRWRPCIPIIDAQFASNQALWCACFDDRDDVLEGQP